MSKIDANDIARDLGANGLRDKVDLLTATAKSYPRSTNTPNTPNAGDWEKPMPFTIAHVLPPFPKAIFPPWLESFVSETTRALEVPYDLPAIVALGVLAVVLQKKFAVRVNRDWLEPLSLFCIHGGEPGSLKTGTFKVFLRPVADFEHAQSVSLADKMRAGEREKHLIHKRIEVLESKLAQKNGGDTQGDLEQAYKALDCLEIPRPPLIYTSDATPESIGMLLAENGGRISVGSAEGAFLEILKGRYSDAPAIEVALSGHGGDALKIHRASKDKPPIILQNPALSLILCVQPHLLESLAANATLAGRGFLSRTLFSIPESTLGNRKHGLPPVCATVADSYYKNVKALLEIPERKPKGCLEIETEELSVTATAQAALVAFKRKLEPDLKAGGEMRDQSGFLSGWAGKAGGLALRVAGLLAVADGMKSVELEHFKRGQAVAEYGVEHAKLVAGIIGNDPTENVARQILGWIARKKLTHFTRRNLTQDLRGIDANKLSEPLNLLIEHGYIRPRMTQPRSGPGRLPAAGPNTFDVNPLI